MRKRSKAPRVETVTVSFPPGRKVQFVEFVPLDSPRSPQEQIEWEQECARRMRQIMDNESALENSRWHHQRKTGRHARAEQQIFQALRDALCLEAVTRRMRDVRDLDEAFEDVAEEFKRVTETWPSAQRSHLKTRKFFERLGASAVRKAYYRAKARAGR